MDIEVANKVWNEGWTLDIDFIEDTIHQLDLAANSKILDIGTGAGVMAVILALSGFDVLTGQPQEEYEEHGSEEGYPDWREAARAFGVAHKITYQYLDAEQLPFPAASFDGVFLYNTLHHIPGKEKALNEFLRVVRPDKVVCIIEMNENGNRHFREKYGFVDKAVVDPRDLVKGHEIDLEFIPGEFSNACIMRKTR